MQRVVARSRLLDSLQHVAKKNGVVAGCVSVMAGLEIRPTRKAGDYFPAQSRR